MIKDKKVRILHARTHAHHTSSDVSEEKEEEKRKTKAEKGRWKEKPACICKKYVTLVAIIRICSYWHVSFCFKKTDPFLTLFFLISKARVCVCMCARLPETHILERTVAVIYSSILYRHEQQFNDAPITFLNRNYNELQWDDKMKSSILSLAYVSPFARSPSTPVASFQSQCR